jgi:hypothetical protein
MFNDSYSLGFNKPHGFINHETFPLPTLAPVLGLAAELCSSRGFFVLRTIPLEKYTREEIAIIYASKFSWLPILDTIDLV